MTVTESAGVQSTRSRLDQERKDQRHRLFLLSQIELNPGQASGFYVVQHRRLVDLEHLARMQQMGWIEDLSFAGEALWHATPKGVQVLKGDRR